MAEASRARAAPLLPGLPDEIFIWEILLRLPHKPLLCCRAVSRAWRRATSARDFLLAHHGRQPALPLLYERRSTADGGGYIDIIPLDHRAGVAAAAADRLRPVARLGTGGAFTQMEASCDGLIILCTKVTCGSVMSPAYYSVCNPTTRQYAPLPQLRGFGIAGMYPHLRTGEYRLLLYPDDYLGDDGPDPGREWYVYALGSREPPRDIGCLEADAEEDAIQTARPVLFRGGLHWFIEKDDDSESSMILVFNTAAELFRRMRAPAVPDVADLFEMDGMLGLASFNDGEVTPIDIWMTQDYDAEVWAFKYRVELPVADLTLWLGLDNSSKLVVSSWDDEGLLFILVKSAEWLLQIGMDGKLVASFHRESLGAAELRLKQTLVPHSFFQTIEGYVVNSWPFISIDDHVVNT